MRASGIMAVMGAGAVAACASAPVPETLDFPTRFSPGTGHALTASGAAPLVGTTVAVTGPGYDQGLAAKDLAARACASRGLALNPAAVGRFASPEWVFAGACA
ncbi:hypothetical protein [Falsirhodobacter xinxiangensis]|uniref:hypothetical protein n=1 Tax=Falsirhodobacter xinxiangensis TaxID=2530049 RepID=UPI0010AA206E|nr:hypothetical protein [Rhodobacter xinxiangensis]